MMRNRSWLALPAVALPAVMLLILASAGSADEPASKATRFAVPSADEQQGIAELIKAKLKDRYAAATNDQGKADLAENLFVISDRLLAATDRARADEVLAYVAYTQCRDIGIDLGYPILFSIASVRLARHYEVDLYPLLTAGYDRMLADAHPSLVYRDITREAMAQAITMENADRYTAAKRLGDIALSAAEKSKSLPLKKMAEGADREMDVRSKLYDGFKKGAAVLEKTPGDPAANSAIGQYLCFVKQDWEAGLPPLAKGSDQALAELARESMKDITATQAVVLADQWWKIAAERKPPLQEPIESFSILLYLAARDGLKEEQQSRVMVTVLDWLPRHPTSKAAFAMAAINATPEPRANPPQSAATLPKPTSAKQTPNANKDHPPLSPSLAQFVRERVASGRTNDWPRTGSGGEVTRDVPAEGALLVRIVVFWSDASRTVPVGVQPLYQTSHGPLSGPVIGQKAATAGVGQVRVGYAVGGLRVPKGAILESGELVHMRVADRQLKKGDGFAMRFAGPNLNRDSISTQGMDGSFVVGVTATTRDGRLTGIGLVTVR